MRAPIRFASVALFTLVAASGCTARPSANAPSSTTSPAAHRMWVPSPDGDPDVRIVTPPLGERALHAKGSKPGRRVLYLNRRGGTYSPGWDNSSAHKSSIIDEKTTIPAYARGDASFGRVVTCVQAEFSRWNVVVTDVDPGKVPHVEAVLGGSPDLLGLPDSVDGVAPESSDGSVMERAVVYVFTEVTSGPKGECEVAAHELGHALGLEHEFLCKDPMTYLSGCGHKTFQDVDAWCGENKAHKCRDGGKQNTVEHLNAVLGPKADDPSSPNDDDPPAITVLSPDDGAAFDSGKTIAVKAKVTSDVALAHVALLWKKKGKTVSIDCDEPMKGVKCKQSGDTFTWKLTGGSGPRSFAVKAMDDDGRSSVSPTRTISFASDDDSDVSNDPPATTGGDAPTIDAPKQGDVVHPCDLLDVHVTMPTDVVALSVWVDIESDAGEQLFPLAWLGGNQWGADIGVAPNAITGPRKLRVVAANGKGVVKSDEPRVIEVEPK